MKKLKIILPIVLLIIIAIYFLTGFIPRYDVFLKSYKVSTDGNTITLKIGVAGSSGYIRTVKKDLGGDNFYLTFYPTFGINSKLGKQEYFDIEISKNTDAIYFENSNNGYKIILKKDETGNWINPNYNPNLKVKKIIDETDNIEDFFCAQALEPFYSDDNYTYYFGCIKSSYVKVIYEDDTEDSIQDALENGRITIKDLDKYNIGYGKEAKVNNIKNIVDLTETSEGLVCASALEEFYRDDKFTYYFSCIKSSQIKVIYSDGTEETIKEALQNNKVTIKDLDKYNIKYYNEKTN